MGTNESKLYKPKRKLLPTNFRKFFKRLFRGKAASHDQLLSPTKFNGLPPLSQPLEYHGHFGNGYHIMPSTLDTLQVSNPAAPRSQSMRVTSHQKMQHSSSTLGGESGFASKTSSTMVSASLSASAPSSPRSVLRKKAPPKPPRMRNHNVDGRLASTDTLSRTPSPLMRSTDVSTLKSSIVDVTNALDTTLSRSFDEGDELPKIPQSPMMRRFNLSGACQEKVHNILAQTKEFLAFELEPEAILKYLAIHGVINKNSEAEIRKARSKQSMCEYLIDIITAKGHEEFTIFCRALRTVGEHGYLADFLEVLDSLVEVATSNMLKPVASNNLANTTKTGTFSFEGENKCSVCSHNNNFGLDEVLEDDSTFDIDISYINRDTNQTKSIREVANMKRRKRPLSITSEEGIILEEADKYIPVIAISLYNQCLVNGGVHILASILETSPCIRELSLIKNHMDDASIKVLCEALAKNRGLSQLDIRLNNIGTNGAGYLAQAIARHSTLRVLKVTSTGLDGTGSSMLIQGIARSISLTDLDIGFNEMSEQACEAMSRCLVGNLTLRKLRMRSNSITSYGARCIFKGLKRNSRVTYVDISKNKIKDESITMLADVMLHNRTLKEINLENCGLTSECCKLLARALKTNTSLRSLDLSLNDIGNDGARAIGEGLRYNKALNTLCMNMCNIGNVGFLSILEALRFNVTMTSLKLCYNKIGNNLMESNGTSGSMTLPDMKTKREESVESDTSYADSGVSSMPVTSTPQKPTLTLSLSSPDAFSSTASPGSPVSQLSLPPALTGHHSYPSTPRNPLSPMSPFSPLSPVSPWSSSFRHPLLYTTSKDTLEILYETLCDVLQQNKALKVLLWGNNFDDGQEVSLQAGCSTTM